MGGGGIAARVLVAAPAASAEGSFGPDAEVTRSEDTGKVIFVGTDPGAPIAAPAGITSDSPAGAAGLAYLEDHADAFGLSGDDLAITEVSSTPSGGAGRPLAAAGRRRSGACGRTDRQSDLRQSDPLRQRRGPAGQRAGHRSCRLEGAGLRRCDLGRLRSDRSCRAPTSTAPTRGSTCTTRVSTVPTAARASSAASRSIRQLRRGIVKRVLVDANSAQVVKTFELVQDALNRSICDDNNVRNADTDCTTAASVLDEGGT